MPHLVEKYSLETALRINKPELTENSYPLPFEDKYVIIISSTGAQAKNYPHYKIVANFLKPILNSAGYKLIQVGGQGDERLEVDLDLCGKTSLYQYFYLIANTELLICGDTSAIHVAGLKNVKFVSLFSAGHPKISGSYFGNPEDHTYITPDNWTPNYVVQEQPPQIARIKPETVINAALKSLNLNNINLESLNIGQLYNTVSVDLVPDSIVPPQVLENIMITIRFDKGGAENVIYEQLKYRKCCIVTDKILNLEFLAQLRPNIENIIYYVPSEGDSNFIKGIMKLGIPLRLVTLLSDDQFNEFKLNYIDFPIVENINKRISAPSELDIINNKINFKSNKRILSNGRAFLSWSHYKMQKPLEEQTDNDLVLDTENFWEDYEFYYLYKI